MPTNNPFPLNIPQKVNSPELLAFFQQFGLDKYLSAEEINKLTQAVQYLYENTGGSPGALPDVVLTVGDLTDLGGNEFEFGTGYSWRLGGNEYENSSPVTVVINPATEGYYRIDVAYVTNEGEILIQEGEESEDVAVEPSIPTGTLKLRTFNVFGEIVSLGSGPNLPFDMTMLDELLEIDAEGYVWMNINGLDVRFQLQLLIDYLSGLNNDFLDLPQLADAPINPSVGISRLFSISNEIAGTAFGVLFNDGQQLRFTRNSTTNGNVTMPFSNGRMEIIRPVSTITASSYTFLNDDTSRTFRVAGTTSCDFVIPNLLSGNFEFRIVNLSTGVVRVTTAGTYNINGGTAPIVIPINTEVRIIRVSTFDFVVNLPGISESKVNELLEGLKTKQPVRVATTANITLSGTQTIDGVALSVDDRVLVKDNSTQSQNGIYLVKAGAWVRTDDANTATELTNAVVSVLEGTANSGATFRQITTSITLGSSNIVWQSFGSSVPDATDTTKGKMKLYNVLGTNLDGAITQALAKTLFEKTWCVFASATVPITTNNATSETIVSELTIPANTWRNQTSFRLEVMSLLGATASGTKQFQYRIGTTSGVLGTLLARFNTTTTSAAGIPFARRCSIYDNKINTNVAATTSLLDNQGGNTGGGNPEIAIDMANPIYIQLTISMPNNADTLTTQDFKCLGYY